MTVSTEHRTVSPSLPSEPFMMHDVIVSSGVVPGAVAAVSAQPEGAPPPSDATSENEETLWEGRYSFKNFLGRIVLGGLLGVGWIALALTTWWYPGGTLKFLTYLGGIVVGGYWLFLGVKLFRGRRDHHYRLTTRRLFLTTGLFQRRVDQVELIRVKDLFVRQSLLGSWLDVGTVILISSEATLPKAHLLGIEHPRRVLDLIWLHTRKERDRRTTEVESV